jgi:C-terminal processing protease CtpA/Prc
VFLAAMKELPGVTLIGRPSRGASGMAEFHVVAGKVEVRLSSMVSFMPDGRVFDWHGVQPDLPVELTPQDFTRAGPDTALFAAAELLRKQMAVVERK